MKRGADREIRNDLGRMAIDLSRESSLFDSKVQKQAVMDLLGNTEEPPSGNE